MKILFLSTVAGLMIAAPLRAADDSKAAEEKVMEHLKSIKGENGARVSAIKGESLAKLFPKFTFVAVLYPQFPVGRQPPESLKPSNVLAVPDEGKIVAITTVDDLKKFFIANVKAKTPPPTVFAWLRLAQELAQDGFYKFKDQGPAGVSPIEGGGASAQSSLDVETAGGNKGGISVVIRVKEDGTIDSIESKSTLSRGPRPRCQATKLLDPDPIVRQMAEDSIRVMGRVCKYYLDEQRAKASPELQKAIDRMWQRILVEGR